MILDTMLIFQNIEQQNRMFYQKDSENMPSVFWARFQSSGVTHPFLGPNCSHTRFHTSHSLSNTLHNPSCFVAQHHWQRHRKSTTDHMIIRATDPCGHDLQNKTKPDNGKIPSGVFLACISYHILQIFTSWDIMIRHDANYFLAVFQHILLGLFDPNILFLLARHSVLDRIREQGNENMKRDYNS